MQCGGLATWKMEQHEQTRTINAGLIERDKKTKEAPVSNQS